MLGISSALSESSTMRIIIPPLSVYCAIMAVGRGCGLSSIFGRGSNLFSMVEASAGNSDVI